VKTKTIYACQSCGYQAAKWLGKCPDCGEWNTFAEETFSKAAAAREQTGFVALTTEKPVTLDKISLARTPRYGTGISELDRVLGGGVVPGSLILLGGDPGIGKSTLILQALDRLMLNKASVLYVTGEESKEQIKMRAERLGIQSSILMVGENSLDRILKHIQDVKPQVVVIDSIQTVYLEHLESAPGSLLQVRECAGKLLYFSKTSGTSTVLIGHVTKEGAIAGPRILEHMVDTVLYFEGENTGQFRILRTIKNRYGSVSEIGVFEMWTGGLIEVSNPSQHFLSGRSDQGPGSCVTSALEGTRPLLIEVQALVSSSNLANPRRTAIGIDNNRVALIVAVMEKILAINLYAQDIYVNAAGGIRLYEPASDLAILLALVSSFRNKRLPEKLVAFGEIGLTGEIRSVSYTDQRVQEARKLGYQTVMLPKKAKFDGKFSDINILRAETVAEAWSHIF
jgi:DNA repair protein RadA/Sms